MIAPFVLYAQLAGTLDLSETSRVDLRTNQPLTVLPDPPPREIAIAADASLTPAARLFVHSRRWELAVTYSPTLSTTDIELTSSAQPVVLNSGAVTAAWHDRSVRVAVSEAASYGWQNLAYLYGTPVAGQSTSQGQQSSPGGGQGTPGTGAQPGQGTGTTPSSGQTLGQTGTATAVPLHLFPYGSSTSTASVQWRASHSVSVSATGGYSISGNLANSSAADTVFPKQYGPSGSVAVGFAPDAGDYLGTTASASEITTPLGACISNVPGQFCRQDVPAFSVREVARHAVSANANLTAGLGLSATIYQLTTGQAWGIVPVASVAYTQRLGALPKGAGLNALPADSVAVSVDADSTVNVFTGLPSNRVALTGTLVHRLESNVALSVTAGATQTVPVPHPDPSPLLLLSGGAEVRVRVSTLIMLSGGLQAFWQDQEGGVVGGGNANASSQVGYLSLTVRAPRWRF